MSGPGGEDGGALDRLLALLDPAPDVAARRYLELRRRLIRFFEWRGARFPEDLADETLSRVGRRLASGVEVRADDPYHFVTGFARNVFYEVLRERRRERELRDPARWPARPPEPESEDRRMEALRACLEELGPGQRDLILSYHEGEGGARIEARRALADALDIGSNALRIRVHRLRVALERCVRDRLGGSR